MWLNELSCLPILLGVSLLLNSSLWARPKPVVSACFPIPSRERPLPPEWSLLSVWESVCAPCCSETWKHDLGPRSGPYESFLYSVSLESFAIR